MSEAAHAEPILRLLILGDFSGHAERPNAVLPVDRQRLDEACARIAPALDLRLAGNLDLKLEMGAIGDLQPRSIVARVPELAALQRVRELAEQVAAGKLEPAEFRSRAATETSQDLADRLAQLLQPEPGPPAGTAGQAPAPAADTPSIDSILDMVQAPDATADSTRETARRLLDSVSSGGARHRSRRGPAAEVLAELDLRISARLDEILHHPEARALEASWRGLRLLVRRTDFAKGISIDLRSVGIDEAAEALEEACEAEDYDAVLADYEIEASARDLERVRALATMGQACQTPVVVAAAPEFLGLESWAQLRKARAPHATFEEGIYDAWRSLREREEARWLVLVANRLALRAAYGPEGENTRGLSYVEGGVEVPGLFGSGIWAIGISLTRAFARSGACVQIAGTRNGLIDDLPLIAGADNGKQISTEGSFSNERREDLERIGLCAVQHYQRDIAFIGAVRCFRKPERYPDTEATADAAQHVTLAYQLYASRLAKFLGRTLPDLVGLDGPQAVEAALRDRVIRYLSTPDQPLTPNRVGVAVEASAEDPSLTDLKLRVGPEIKIAGRPVNVLFGFSVRL